MRLVKVIVSLLLTAAAAGCLVSLPNSGGSSPKPTGDADLAEHKSGLVLVRLSEGTEAAAAAAAVGGKVVAVRRGMARIELPKGATVSAALSKLAQVEGVAYAEPVYIYRRPIEVDKIRAGMTRDSSGEYEQWGMGPQGINAAAVWEILDQTALDNLGNIRVAVVDTGIDISHPEFTAQTNRIAGGYNAITGSTDPDDYADGEGHGTHVAGIIGAAHDDKGVRGVAPTVKMLSVKVLNSEGYGFNDDIADGIIWAVDHGAHVINMSLGGTGRSRAIQEAVDYALANGVLVVAAMGNGYRTTLTHYPAACEGVIAVGATMPDGTRADFSSQGPCISVAAPGVDILSSVWPQSYAYYDGTSMSSPHVAGLVALLLSKAPGASPAQIRTCLEDTASLGGSAWNKQLGYGEIDAQAAYGAFGPSYTAMYERLTVSVTQNGHPAVGAEVLIRSGSSTVASNRTGTGEFKAEDRGKAHFHYLKAGVYQIYVRLGDAAESGSINHTVGTPCEVTIDLPGS